MFFILFNRVRLSFLSQVLSFLLLLAFLLPAQAAEDVEIIPGVGLSYHFGGKFAQNALAFKAGWQDFGMGDALGNRPSIDLLNMYFLTSRQEIRWSVAGLPLSESGSRKAGVSRVQKWAIGLGVTAAAIYVVTDQLNDEIDDAIEDGFTPGLNESADTPDNDDEPGCQTSAVCL